MNVIVIDLHFGISGESCNISMMCHSIKLTNSSIEFAFIYLHCMKTLLIIIKLKARTELVYSDAKLCYH